MKCHWCDEPPVAACVRCGMFYCPAHGGGAPRLGSLCNDHADFRRAGFGCAAFLGIAGGIGMIAWTLSEPWSHFQDAALILRCFASFLILVGIGFLAIATQGRGDP